MTTPATTSEGLAALLAELSVKLPLRLHGEDVGVVVDASLRDVFTVDVNSERPDQQAMKIAELIALTVNFHGSATLSTRPPRARSSSAGPTPAAVLIPTPSARTAAGELISQQAGVSALLEELEVREGDLVMLRRAIEEGDPKAELLVRVNDMLRETRAAIARVEGR